MSHARKHLVQQLDDEFQSMAELEQGRVAVGRVRSMRGTHCEVDVPALGGCCLALVPTRLRGVVHLRRGVFVALELGDVPDTARFKLRATVLQPLLEAHQAQIRAKNLWPAEFDRAESSGKEEEEEESTTFEGGNPNRRPAVGAEWSSSSDSDSDYDDDDDED